MSSLSIVVAGLITVIGATIFPILCEVIYAE